MIAHTREQIHCRQEFVTPDVHGDAVQEDEPEDQRGVVALWRGVAAVVQDGEPLDLQCRRERGRRCQHDLATDRDPSREPSRGGSRVRRCKRRDPVVLSAGGGVYRSNLSQGACDGDSADEGRNTVKFKNKSVSCFESQYNVECRVLTLDSPRTY